MRRAAILPVCWGAFLAALTALLTPFKPRTIVPEMLGAAAAGSLIVGLCVWVLDRRRGRLATAERRVLSDGSVATVTLVAGLALALIGAGFGLWLILIGAIVAAFGVGGLAREQMARRRALRRLSRRAS